MQVNNDRFASKVAVSGGTFEHVSENFAKHLPYQHAFSTKRHPVDQADGVLAQGIVICNDGVFIANERIASYIAKNGGSADYPASGEVIAMCEWPTKARIRDLHVYATTGNEDPEDWNTNYFTEDTAAAFPAFTLSAIDPEDTSFEIPLLEDFTQTFTDDNGVSGGDDVDVVTQRLSLQARAFGVNRRRNPLIISATLGGSVVADSALFVYAEFVIPHV